MKHTVSIGLLNFPSPITGDVYPQEIIEETIKRYKKRIDSRIMVGCLFDSKKTLYDTVGNKKKEHDTEYEADIYKLKRELTYYKVKSMNVSHIITDLRIEKDRWVAEIETLPTGKGLKLKTLLEQKEKKVTFKPVIAKDKSNGIVTRINELVSIDGILEK